MSEIKLTGKHGVGKFVRVSKEDSDKLNDRRLCCLESGYVMIWNRETNKAEYLHRWLLNLSTGDKTVVDHMDGNKLNCQRDNLRVGTTSENMCNRKKFSKHGIPTSQYKGVVLRNNKWHVNLKKDNRTYYLGTFTSELEAAKAYNEKALELHQHYAVLNILPCCAISSILIK